jgi:hypothetical protein
LERTAENARRGKAYLDDAKYAGLWNSFCLYPNQDNITIYALLPDAPTRGIICTPEVLDDLAAALDAHGEFEYERDLKPLGFRKKANPPAGGYLEEDVQARFCREMLAGGEQYGGIKFVAMELNVPEYHNTKTNKAGTEGRIDVAGIKNNTLYLFELKKKRENAAYDQVREYGQQVRDNLAEYSKLLQFYPNMGGITIEEIKSVAVMPYSENHHLKSPDDIADWLFEVPFDHGLVFHRDVTDDVYE